MLSRQMAPPEASMSSFLTPAMARGTFQWDRWAGTSAFGWRTRLTFETLIRSCYSVLLYSFDPKCPQAILRGWSGSGSRYWADTISGDHFPLVRRESRPCLPVQNICSFAELTKTTGNLYNCINVLTNYYQWRKYIILILFKLICTYK